MSDGTGEREDPFAADLGGCSHSWRFDGDDPYIECVLCGEYRDAITGRTVRRALLWESGKAHPPSDTPAGDIRPDGES